MDELLDKLTREGSQPHLWMTIGENVLKIAMCAEVGVTEKVKGTLSNRWMSVVSIVGTFIEVIESVKCELTIEWLAVQIAQTNTLCCWTGNLINKKCVRFWGC